MTSILNKKNYLDIQYTILCHIRHQTNQNWKYFEYIKERHSLSSSSLIYSDELKRFIKDDSTNK